MSLAEPPRQFGSLKQKSSTPSYAVGWPGINAALSHVLGAMPFSRGFKILKNLNQKGGVDCPSCAWPDPAHRSKLGEYCENGAKAIADEATTRRTGTVLFQRYTIDELASKSDHWLGLQGRLTQPMYRAKNTSHYVPISYHEAFDLIGKELRALNSPDEALFYTSGRSSNEAAYLYQLFVRAFGTNNLPDCSNMCHESSGVALSQTLGLGKGSVTLEDFEHAEVIMILGQNPGTNHPRMLSTLEHAKKKGARIIAINPLIEPGLVGFKNPQTAAGLFGKTTQLADQYLQIKINGDHALLLAINKALIDLGRLNKSVLDEHFIKNNTQGFDELKTHLKGVNIDQMLAYAGIDLAEFQQLISLLASKKRIIVCWAMGLTQHKNAVATIREIVNLLLLKGSIGIKGGGTCPVRGHSNVQGDRSVGIMHKPSEKLNIALKKRYGFLPPQSEGLDVVASIKAMHAGKAKVFLALGGNFLSAAPDTHFTAEALKKTKLTVHISTKLNRSHLITGQSALILPCLGRTDQDKNGFLTTENSMGQVQKTKGVLSPPEASLKSEPEIVAGIAHATIGDKYGIAWIAMGQDYNLIRTEIAAVIEDFKDFESALEGPEPHNLPNGPRQGKFLKEGALFTSNRFEPIHLEKDEYLLMTIRSHDQFNTTVYGLNDRYRGIYGERRVLFMNQIDIDAAGFEKHQVVNLRSNYGEERAAHAFKIVPYNIPEKCVAAYFPEANPLVPIDAKADESHTPTSKSIKIMIEPA